MKLHPYLSMEDDSFEPKFRNRKYTDMKTFLFYIFIILLFFASCSKDDTRIPVTAGIYDTSFIYHEFSPPLNVELTLDTLTDNYFGNDSIDINQDGVYDLFISQRIHFPLPTGTPTWEHFPYYWLTLRNGLEAATKTEYEYGGMGYVGGVDWVDTLNYENRIDNISKWSESNVTLTMWRIPAYTVPIFSPTSYGPWYDLTNSEKYIAIRMKIGSHYKYGWIKVNEISKENIQFVCYTLEK